MGWDQKQLISMATLINPAVARHADHLSPKFYPSRRGFDLFYIAMAAYPLDKLHIFEENKWNILAIICQKLARTGVFTCFGWDWNHSLGSFLSSVQRASSAFFHRMWNAPSTYDIWRFLSEPTFFSNQIRSHCQASFSAGGPKKHTCKGRREAAAVRREQGNMVISSCSASKAVNCKGTWSSKWCFTIYISKGWRQQWVIDRKEGRGSACACD